MLKRIASALPLRWQQHLKRIHFGRQIRRGLFVTNDPEWLRLGEWVFAGDWVIDIGANVGHYTSRLSQLVGEGGRVIACEPIAPTFELLASNIALLPDRNVTLLNIAVSSESNLVRMQVPQGKHGLDDYYLAHITSNGAGEPVVCMPIDSFVWPEPIRLVKIDAEGHEPHVLRGMVGLLKRDKPILIVERSEASNEVRSFLTELGYTDTYYDRSPNEVWRVKP